MTLFENFASSDAARQVRLLDDQLRARHSEEPPGVFLEEQGISYDQIDAILDPETPPAGIFGAGVISQYGHESVAIFVVETLLGDRKHSDGLAVADVYETDALSIIRLYTDSFGKDLKVVGLPQPEEHAYLVAGDEVTSAGMRGTCGVEVVTSTGVAGALSAGHVLQRVGSTVNARRTPVGTVSFSDFLSANPSGSDVADVAVFDLDNAVAMSGLYPITSQGSAKPLDHVVAHGQSGAQVGTILAAVPSFALRTGIGCWKDALLTDRAISQAGDSGAPVYRNDGSGTIVGHVVGGYPPAYTIVQDIGYLLQEANATLA